MLLNCYNSTERVEQFSLYEVCEGEEYQRKLHPDDSPLRVTQRWTTADRHLRIRRNPDYNPHRRKVCFYYKYCLFTPSKTRPFRACRAGGNLPISDHWWSMLALFVSGHKSVLLSPLLEESSICLDLLSVLDTQYIMSLIIPTLIYFKLYVQLNKAFK